MGRASLCRITGGLVLILKALTTEPALRCSGHSRPTKSVHTYKKGPATKHLPVARLHAEQNIPLQVCGWGERLLMSDDERGTKPYASAHSEKGNAARLHNASITALMPDFVKN